MKSVLRKIGLIGSMMIVAPAFIGGVALADGESCERLMRNNLEQDLSAAAPGVNQLTLCSDTVSGEEALNRLNGLSLAERKASKELLCGKAKPVKKVKAQQRVLRNLIGNKLLREHEQCLELSKKGASVVFNTPTADRRIVNVAVEIDKPGVELREVSVEPEGSMNCSGFDSIGGLNNQGLWGVCERNPQVPAPVSIIRIRLNRGLLNIRVADPALTPNPDAINGARWQHQALPNIADCYVSSVANRILTCSTHLSQVLCHRELMAGNVNDCRMILAPRVYPNRPERQVHYQVGEFELETRGNLGVTVRRGRPGIANFGGHFEYTANFETPTLPERSSNVCDRSCPLFDRGVEPCNRNCLVADNIYENEHALGVESLTREVGDSCSAPISGSVELSEIDKYRAYNLCEAQNAWGRTTTGIFYAQISKYFYMNDYRTTHTREYREIDGRTYRFQEWTLTNAGERVRSIAPLEVPFTVYCNG